MIVENKYMGYDYDRHEYYLKDKNITELIPYQDAEIKEILPFTDKALKRISQRIYQYVYSKNTAQNRKHIQYRIYLDLNGERMALQDAIVEYLIGALESNMDLNAYQDEQLNDVPHTASEYLRNVGLFNRGVFKDTITYGDDF